MTKARKLAIFADGIDRALDAVQYQLDQANARAEDYVKQWRKENPDADDAEMKNTWWWSYHQSERETAAVLPELIKKLENLTL